MHVTSEKRFVLLLFPRPFGCSRGEFQSHGIPSSDSSRVQGNGRTSFPERPGGKRYVEVIFRLAERKHGQRLLLKMFMHVRPIVSVHDKLNVAAQSYIIVVYSFDQKVFDAATPVREEAFFGSK